MFRAFCIAHQILPEEEQIDPDGEMDWHDMSIGFFKALGLSNEDAWDLAREVRYDHEYYTADVEKLREEAATVEIK